MTVREALRLAGERLERAGVPDAALDARLLLAHIVGENPLMLSINGARELNGDALAAFTEMVKRREAREPLQQITGEAAFMGMTFRVTPDVLIPRQDTEILCEEALRRIGGRQARALDVGTGSGALAVSISLLSRADVTATDISAVALSVARENAHRLGAQVRFLEGDLYEAVGDERFDVIVSNPPYISREEMAALMPEVHWEPETALYGGEDGLDFYRRLTKDAAAHLRPGGALLLETGYRQRDAVCAMLAEHVGTPFALKDYGGNWRVAGACLADGPRKGRDDARKA